MAMSALGEANKSISLDSATTDFLRYVKTEARRVRLASQGYYPSALEIATAEKGVSGDVRNAPWRFRRICKNDGGPRRRRSTGNAHKSCRRCWRHRQRMGRRARAVCASECGFSFITKLLLKFRQNLE